MKRIGWVLLLMLSVLGAVAQNSKATKALESKRATLNKEIKESTALLKQTENNSKSQISRINLLTRQIEARSEMIVLLVEETKILEKEITALGREIEKLRIEYGEKQKQYGKALQTMQRGRKAQDKILFVLSAESFSQSLRRMRYLKEYSSWQRIQAQSIKNKQMELQAKRDELEQKKKAKASLLTQKEEESSTLKKEERERQVKLGEMKKEEKKLRNLIAKKRKSIDELNRQIEEHIAREIEASQKAQKAEGAASERKSETPGGLAMTKQEQKLSSSFGENKGKLPYPVSGSSTVVDAFGVHPHRIQKQVIIDNKGIDIQTEKNARVKVVFDGVVTFISQERNDMAVVVRHGNYLTVYSHLDEIYVKKGDKVSIGQQVGRVYNDETLGSVLRFQVQKDKVWQNPAHWIRK